VFNNEQLFVPDYKLLPCFECLMLSSGLFPGVCNLSANVSEHSEVHTHTHTQMGCQKNVYTFYIITVAICGRTFAQKMALIK
jgi:hypothetical protein